MKNVLIKNSNKKGKGLFSNKNLKKGELILINNKGKLKKYNSKELVKLSSKITEHADYVGHGKYVLDFSPSSYMNHSCNPNTFFKMNSILLSKVYTLRDIKKGEELTHDYQLTAVDQINNKNGWKMKCKCGSKSCRKVITGDFFKLPKALQRRFYKNLPTSIKKKYYNKISKLK